MKKKKPMVNDLAKAMLKHEENLKDIIKEKPKEKKSDMGWVIFASAFIIFCGILLAISAWERVAEKDYMSSLTPEERKAIADQEAKEELEKEQADIEWQDSINNVLRQGLTPGGVLMCLFGSMAGLAVGYISRVGGW